MFLFEVTERDLLLDALSQNPRRKAVEMVIKTSKLLVLVFSARPSARKAILEQGSVRHLRPRSTSRDCAKYLHANEAKILPVKLESRGQVTGIVGAPVGRSSRCPCPLQQAAGTAPPPTSRADRSTARPWAESAAA